MENPFETKCDGEREDYAYHFTNTWSLDSILREGLISEKARIIDGKIPYPSNWEGADSGGTRICIFTRTDQILHPEYNIFLELNIKGLKDLKDVVSEDEWIDFDYTYEEMIEKYGRENIDGTLDYTDSPIIRGRLPPSRIKRIIAGSKILEGLKENSIATDYISAVDEHRDNEEWLKRTYLILSGKNGTTIETPKNYIPIIKTIIKKKFGNGTGYDLLKRINKEHKIEIIDSDGNILFGFPKE